MRHVLSSVLLLAASVPAFATIDSGLLALAPAGAKIISGVDVNRAKSSPFGQFILTKMNSESTDPNHQGFLEMTQLTGFDPRRDVQDVLFVSAGPLPDGSNTAFGVLVRGNFDQSRIKSTLLAKGATVQPYQGVDVMLDKSSQGRSVFAFLDVDIAVMGDVATVQQMIANRSNPTALDPALQKMIAAVGANHDAWFASLGASSFLTDSFRQQAGGRVQPEALQSILQSSGGVAFGNIVQVSFDALARSPKDATSLEDVVRFGASMVQMQRQQNTGADMLAAALDNMTLTTSGSNVHLALSLPEAGIEQLAELKGQHRAGGGFKTATPSQQ